MTGRQDSTHLSLEVEDTDGDLPFRIVAGRGEGAAVGQHSRSGHHDALHRPVLVRAVLLVSKGGALAIPELKTELSQNK